MMQLSDTVIKNRSTARKGRFGGGFRAVVPRGIGWIPALLLLGGCGQIGIEELPIPALGTGPENIGTETGTPDRGGPDTVSTGTAGTADTDAATQQIVVDTDALLEIGSSDTPTPSDMARATEGPTDTGLPGDTLTGSEAASEMDSPSDTALPSESAAPTDTDMPVETDTATDRLQPTETATAQPTETETATATETETDTYQPECAALYSDALLCDGFEDGIVLNTDMRACGSLEVASSPVFEGVSSLHARAASTYCLALVYGAFPPETTGNLYFRAYYFLPSGSMTGLVKLAAFRGWNTNTELAELDVDFNVRQGGIVEIHSHANGGDYQSSPGKVSENSWFCLQGSVLISDTAGIATLGINGTTVLNVEGLDTRPPSGISLADFGIGWTQDGVFPMDVYVDNIVVDTSPVPCN